MRESKNEKRIQRAVTFVCVTMFVVFSFVFLAVYQGPLLEIFYDKVANGKLQYNPFVVAGVITLILTSFALWLNTLVHFKREWTAITYFPSCIILSFITDIDRAIYTGEYSCLKWVLVFIISILLCLLFIFIFNRLLFAKIKNPNMEGYRIVWRNLLILSLMFVLTGTLSSDNEDIKNEARAYCYYKRGDIDKALNVARRTVSASHELTSSRAYYLALADKLGESLFNYPQNFASQGLLPKADQTTPLANDSIYSLFPVERVATESVADYLRRAVETDSVNKSVADYYLSSLLLDRHLDECVANLPEYYNIADDTLPRHYKEAVALYSDVACDSTIAVDEAVMEKYIDFRKIEQKYPDILSRSNRVRYKYGNTYWYYYHYGN